MASGKGYGEESSWFCSASSLEKMALIPSSHRQIRDMLKGHLQVVKAQGQDESVNPEGMSFILPFTRLQVSGANTKPRTSTGSSQLTRATGHSGVHLLRGVLSGVWEESGSSLRTYSFEKQAIPISTDQWHSQHLTSFQSTFTSNISFHKNMNVKNIGKSYK